MKKTKCGSVTIEEVRSLASVVEELAQNYIPSVPRIHMICPWMVKHGYSPIDLTLAKVGIILDIAEKYPTILDSHLERVPDTIMGMQLLWFAVAEYLPDSLVRKSYLRAHVTWFDIPGKNLVIASTRYSEDDLANMAIESRFESQPDQNSDSYEPESFTVRSKMNDYGVIMGGISR